MSDRSAVLQVLGELRAQRRRTVQALSSVREDQLTVHVGPERPADVRHVLLMLAQNDDRRRVAIEVTLSALGWQALEAQRILPSLALTRGKLRAALIGLADPQLDEAPAPGEWGVRQTLRHLMNNENRFIADAAYAVERLQRGADLPVHRPGPPSGPGELGPEAPGRLADVVDKLEETRDRLVADAALLTAEELAGVMPVAGMAADVRYVLHRRATHERQHTVQIYKILRGIGCAQSEVQMLLGEAEIARAALEGVVAGLPDALVDRYPGSGLPTVRQLLEQARDEEASALARVLQAL